MHFGEKIKILYLNFLIPKGPKSGLDNVFMRKYLNILIFFLHAVKVLQKSKFVT
jgi:hypothetical protein